MTDENLRQLLSSVHERLSSSSSVDPETHELLATVMRDIEGALGKRAAGASMRPTQPRLEALAVRFEAEHPSTAQLLRQIGELLSQAGI
jgi:hypothetical protein